MDYDSPKASTGNQPLDDGPHAREPLVPVGPISLESLLQFPGVGIADSLRFRLALERLNSYSDAAARQVPHIAESHAGAVAALDRGDFAEYDRLRAQEVVEAHFYFICWDSVHKTLARLQQNTYGFRAHRPIFKTYGDVLKYYSEARDHLEHYPERLPGEPKTDWRETSEKAIEGTLPVIDKDGRFHFQGKSWDVDTASAKLLWLIVEEFRVRLYAEAHPRFMQAIRNVRAQASADNERQSGPSEE